MPDAFILNNDLEMECVQFSIGLGLGAHLAGDQKNGNKCTWRAQHLMLTELLMRITNARGEIPDNTRRPYMP